MSTSPNCLLVLLNKEEIKGNEMARMNSTQAGMNNA
jgi:hypothetical protein